ncbi:hypothetical protein GKQ77_05215, partial [Streptomyces sp. BG9H]|nr:hypothetical protein [Streptomyces anatolicus]
MLTSVTLRLQFIKSRKDTAGDGYRALIRLLKAWIRESKEVDSELRYKSFLIELLVAHLWDVCWNGEPFQVDDYPAAIEQVLSYIVRTGLRTPIVFSDYYKADAVDATAEPIQVWDPVNAENNVARGYSEHHRQRLVNHARVALDTISTAAYTLVRAREARETSLGRWPALAMGLLRVLADGAPIDVELDGHPCRLWLLFAGNSRYHPPGFAPSYR